MDKYFNKRRDVRKQTAEIKHIQTKHPSKDCCFAEGPPIIRHSLRLEEKEMDQIDHVVTNNCKTYLGKTRATIRFTTLVGINKSDHVPINTISPQWCQTTN